jgi:adenosylmethionine-8-amino-7-oxononanoate aminotransferase
VVVLGPPLGIGPQEIEQIADALEGSIDEVVARVAASL